MNRVQIIKAVLFRYEWSFVLFCTNVYAKCHYPYTYASLKPFTKQGPSSYDRQCTYDPFLIVYIVCRAGLHKYSY